MNLLIPLVDALSWDLLFFFCSMTERYVWEDYALDLEPALL